MAEPLKYMYNPVFFERLCPFLDSAIVDFNCQDFIFRVFDSDWPDLELKQRVRHIAIALHHFLPADFPKAASILTKLSELLLSKGFRSQGFANIFIPEYVQIYGVNDSADSLKTLRTITKLVSGEFAIRPFILNDPESTLKMMLEWTSDPDENVRRLASEGCRPRLPWAMGVPFLKKHPTTIIPILEQLKSDPSEYVRRSVANNLNDIAKDHPELVLQIVKRWRNTSPETDWIIKHGCRTLLKKGHTAALKLHGFHPESKAKISGLKLEPNKIKIGDTLQFNFSFVNKETKRSTFRLEYAIDFITRTQKTSKKIFKITEKEFQPGAPVTFSRKQSFKDLTTRKHTKGKHRLYIIANGKTLAFTDFSLA